VDKFPHTRAAIEALAPTHAERRRALGDVSETHYYALLRGELPEDFLRRWLTHLPLIHAIRRDLGLDASADAVGAPAPAYEEVSDVR
jgi:hypothetical protein